MKGGFAAGLAALVLIFAGCATPGEPAAGPTTSSFAPAPTADEMTGAIKGLVVDPEAKPIAGAEVGTDKGQIATSDESGAFTFNGLEPGTYSIIAQALGYDSTGRKIEVKPGEVAEMTLHLTPIVILELYHWTFSKVGHVRLGQYTLQAVQNTVNHTVVDTAFCDPCSFPVELQLNLTDGVTDVLFTRALSVPAVNDIVIWAYTKAQTGPALVSNLATHEAGPRDTHHWTETQIKSLKGLTKARLEFRGPDPDHPGVLVQQKIELWQTFAQGGVLPADFTALPPA